MNLRRWMKAWVIWWLSMSLMTKLLTIASASAGLSLIANGSGAFSILGYLLASHFGFIVMVGVGYHYSLYDITNVDLPTGTGIYFGHMRAFQDLFRGIDEETLNGVFKGAQSMVAFKLPDNIIIIPFRELNERDLSTILGLNESSSFVKRMARVSKVKGVITMFGNFHADMEPVEAPAT